MRSYFLLLLSVFLLAAGGQAAYVLSAALDDNGAEVSAEKQKNLWNQYCNKDGDVPMDSVQLPKVDYSNSLVMAAADKLNTVAPVSIYLYHQVTGNLDLRKDKVEDSTFPWEKYEYILDMGENRQYGVKKQYDPQTGQPVPGSEEFSMDKLRKKFAYQYKMASNPAPQGVKGNSHAFLTYLCGEFRDRPTMIREKLEWVASMIKMPLGDQSKVNPSKDLKNIWEHINAQSYYPYIRFSRAAYHAKESALGGHDDQFYAQMRANDPNLPENPQTLYYVTKPVPAYTVCETKYIFTEYITAGNHQFPGWEAYKTGLDSYEQQYCSQEDKDYYYDFRGDSNIKPNSPESNAMIWHGTSVQSACQRKADGSVFVASIGNGKITQQQCEKYYKKPFGNRWNAARGGLATWLLRDKKYDDQFINENVKTYMLPTWDPELSPIGMRPTQGENAGVELRGYKGQFLDEWEARKDVFWVSPDLGANTIFGLGSNQQNTKFAFERLRDTVNRHTNWYSSGYDDGVGRVIDQVYSPYVASSYEMSESDQFAQPGVTVKAPADDRKQWMFVFKVHKDNWYNTRSLAEGKGVDFEKHWIDETTFGTNSLANKERAWDKLGTALEGEFETMLYLHNIKRNGSIEDDGLGQTHN